MNFLKLNFRKLFISIVIFVAMVIFFLPIIKICTGFCPLDKRFIFINLFEYITSEKVITSPSSNPFMGLYVEQSSQSSSIYIYFIILEFIVAYLLSCFVVYVYKKFKK